MDLFTLIIDFDGGTYIAQATAGSIKEAPNACVENWHTHEISEQDKITILELLSSEEFVPVSGVENVWCGCVQLRQSLLIMHLVLTTDVI